MSENVQTQFQDNLKYIILIHNNIMDLYNDYLYENGWDENTIKKFEHLLNEYNLALDTLKKIVPLYKWNSSENEEKFKKFFTNVIIPDNVAYNYAKIRHDAYLTYRAKRKSIIMSINDALHYFTGQEIELLDYFNDKCAKVQLETPDMYHTPILKYWLKNNISDVLSDIKNSYKIEGKYSSEVVERAFYKYTECRTIAFKIFNMLTSSNPINGYNKYNKFLDKYINGSLSKAVIKHLSQSVKDEDDFIDYDDQQQNMDQEAWTTNGIYESFNYWTLFNNGYERDKSQVKKIDMVPTNANICKVYSDGNYVYAQRKFYPGDIIEICPCIDISKQSLYTNDIRKIVFDVDNGNRYVIPMGYCQYYDIPNNNLLCNCEYLWDPNKSTIVIKAIRKIAKNEKLVLKIH